MRFTRRRRRFGEPMLSVHQRPFSPDDRSQPGHWEGDDVIVGPQHRSAIGTLVERHTRYVKLIHLPRPDSFQLRDGLLRELAGLPAGLLQSITWDQGSEMARHLDITAATGAAVYFCDAGSPWQRGANENTGFYANTFQRALTCPDTPASISSGSNENSTTDPERSSTTVVPPRSSPSC
jgi:IS30 family transposase